MKAYGVKRHDYCCPGHDPDGNWHSKHGSKNRRKTIKKIHKTERRKTKEKLKGDQNES